MRKLITLATLVASTLVVAPAPAPASAAIRCPTPYPKYELPFHASGTTCKVAQDVARHAGPCDGHFRVDGYTWTCAVYSRAHDHTYCRFTGHKGGHTALVWITNRYPVS